MPLTTRYDGDLDARAFVAELQVDALNWARVRPTRRLRRDHARLLAVREKYPRQGAWDRVRLAAAHQVLTERGLLLAPVVSLPRPAVAA